MQEGTIHEVAEAELIEAATFYEARSPGLGEVFLNAVEGALRQIVAHPKAGAVVKPGIRRRLVERFPYSMLYAIEPGRIRVLAVSHNSRRPGHWRDRM